MQSDAGGPQKLGNTSRDYSSSESANAADSEAETVIVEENYGRCGNGNKPLKRIYRRIESSESESDDAARDAALEDEEESDLSDDSQRARRKKKKLVETAAYKASPHEHSRSGSPAVSSMHTVQAVRKDGTPVRDASGRLMLQKLCDKGDFLGAKRLVEGGADVNDRDYAGNTALHDAALKGHYEIVKLLLDHGAIIDIRSGVDDLDTPLIDATSRGHLEIVKLLLTKGADPRIFNAQGKNALDFLPEGETGAEIEKLLKEYAIRFRNKRRGSEVISDTENDKALSYDSSRSIPGTFPEPDKDKRPVAHPDKLVAGRKRGGARAQSIRNDLLWMDLTTKTGREQVYKKAADGDIQYVGRSLEEGWQPDADCLVLAAKHGHTDLVGLLLAFGVPSDGISEEGHTALHETVGRGHVDTIKLLLESGSDPCKLDKQGRSYVDLAKEALGSDDEETVLLVNAERRAKGMSSGYLSEPTATPVSTSKGQQKPVSTASSRGSFPSKEGVNPKEKVPKDVSAANDINGKETSSVKRPRSEEADYRVKKKKSDLDNRKHNGDRQFEKRFDRRPSLGDVLKAKQQQYLNKLEERSDKEKHRKEKSVDKGKSTDKSGPSASPTCGQKFYDKTVSRSVDGAKPSPVVIKNEPMGTFPKIVDTESLEGMSLNCLKSDVIKIERDVYSPMVVIRDDQHSERDPYSERAERERAERERAKERDQLDRIKMDRLEMDRIEVARLEKEQVEKERLEKDRIERERLEIERLEKEKIQRELLEKARLEKEQLEKERLGKERLEKLLFENERIEKERIEKERIEEGKARAAAERAREEERQRLRELARQREVLEAQKDRERKERERQMLLNLEAEEKRKEEKRKREMELEEARRKKVLEEEEKRKALETEQELERRMGLQRLREAEILKNYPYGIRMAGQGRHTFDEMRRYLPLLARSFGSSDSSSYHFLDVQIYLTLGIPNVHQLCKYDNGLCIKNENLD